MGNNTILLLVTTVLLAFLNASISSDLTNAKVCSSNIPVMADGAWMHNSSSRVKTFLTFQENNAEEAMEFYVSLFDNSEVLDVQRYGNDGPAIEGSIMLARFSLDGMEILCSDSYIRHEWDFTPAVSLFVECDSEEQLNQLFEKLSADGKVYMPLGNYGFSQKFGFVEDRFGVSWQLNLP